MKSAFFSLLNNWSEKEATVEIIFIKAGIVNKVVFIILTYYQFNINEI